MSRRSNSSRRGGGASRGGRSGSRGGSTGRTERSGRSSGGRSSRGESKGGESARDKANFVKVGDLNVTKAASNREGEILDNMIKLIDDGASLTEVLQESGLQLWLRFWFPEDGSMKFQSEDKVIISFKEPGEKAPEFNVASASFDVNS